MTVKAETPTARAVRSRRERRAVEARIQGEMAPFVKFAAENPACLEDDALLGKFYASVVRACGSEGAARATVMRRLLVSQQQRDEMLKVLKSLRAQKPILGWVLSQEFTVGGNGQAKRYVFASALGRAAPAPECFAVVDEPSDGDNGDGRGRRTAQAPDPPYLGLIDPANRLFLGPADEIPSPPLPAEMLEVVASRPETKLPGLAEIEVSDGLADKSVTVLARPTLAEDVRKKIDDDGESVHVRCEGGVATAIHKSADERHEDWLEYPPVDGPSVRDLIFPRWLRDEWDRDIRHLAMGRPVRVELIGPTGTGKTSAAERVGRDALSEAGKIGKPRRGFALIRVSSSRIGSSYIHQTERNLFRAFARAKALARKGYLVIILCDEADALLGEMDGAEHSHNRSERLAAQSLLTDPIDNVAIYLTMNARRNSWLPAAIDRRFLKRTYGRTTRGQIEAVAAHYVAEHPQALKALRMSAAEFGGAMADNIFSDRRVIGTVHLFSGKTLPIHARDLHDCSPGKVKDLVQLFVYDVADGIADSLDPLWSLIDREFLAPSLNNRNVFELTFLAEPHDDKVRNVEPAGRKAGSAPSGPEGRR